MSPTVGHIAGGSWVELVTPGALLVVAYGRLAGRRRVLCVAAATALLAAALPPVGRLAAVDPSWHMLQHLLIMLVAAPCLGGALAAGPTAIARPWRRILRRLVWHPWAPVGAAAFHMVVVAGWHLPGPYDGALGSAPVHVIEHASMLSTGAWWWATLGHHARRSAVGPALLSVLGVATAGAGLGILLMFAPAPLYGHGSRLDQQLSGALMAGAMGGMLAVSAGLAVAAYLRRTDRSPPRIWAGRLGVIAAVATLAYAPAVVAAATEDLGESLYRRDCASCHGAEGEGTRRGPSLKRSGEASQHYYLHTGRMPISDIGEPPSRKAVRYNDDQLDALIDFAAALGEGPSMPAAISGSDVPAGGIDYRLHCASCHGASGMGGTLAIQGYAPSLMPASPDEVIAAMLAGPGAMPSFAAVLDEATMADVTAYVGHLQDPPGTGVSVPGGRVGEGIVAGLALVGLVVAARLIGHTR